MSYSGWTNYETWAINLWMANDYQQWRDRASELYEDEGDEARYMLDRELKEYWEESKPELDGPWADLLSGALSEVNWHEIAESWLEEFVEDKEQAS